jgi:hypothetical protein
MEGTAKKERSPMSFIRSMKIKAKRVEKVTLRFTYFGSRATLKL